MTSEELNQIGGGNISIRSAIMQAEKQYGERFVTFFLEIIAVRKQRLWWLYEMYLEKNRSATFLKFIEDAVRENIRTKGPFPKECKLDSFMRRQMEGEVRHQAFNGGPGSEDEHLQIYYTVPESAYQKMRDGACNHCLIIDCIHYHHQPATA